MNQEEKIRKWLEGELSESEQKEFEGTTEFAELSRLFKAVHHFRAPGYDTESEYLKLTERLVAPVRSLSFYERISPVFRIAAIFILALTIGYFSYTYFSASPVSEDWIAGRAEVYLPDSSFVSLNAGSEIRYSGNKWGKARNVELQGEAFFRVKKGSRFTVESRQGTVSVLGTEFTVKDWENYYEVSCYSGSVKVSAGEKPMVLKPGLAFRIVEGKEENYSFAGNAGTGWIQGESSFRSVPLRYVISELERQYTIKVETPGVNLDQLFTGSFSHENLEIALKSITLPLHLHYEMKDKIIVISIEGN